MSRLRDALVGRAGRRGAADGDPAVTIVVPVYGTEQYLEACLASLLRQTFRHLEVVVVDDASPGDVAEIVARVMATDARVRLVRHHENQGLAGARLTGGREARGTYLGFVDSDDEIEDWYVEALHTAATRHDADFVQCAFTQFEPDGTVYPRNRGGDAHQLHGDAIMHGLLGGSMSNSLWSKLVRTSVWRAATGPHDAVMRTVFFGEDLLTMFLIAAHSTTFAHIPDAGYRYIRRASSVTLVDEVGKIVGCIDDLDRVFRFVRPLLVARAEPAELTKAYFEREFLLVVRELLERAAACGTGAAAGLPASPRALGLLGAVSLGCLDIAAGYPSR